MSRKCDLLNIGVMSGNNVSHSNRKTRRRFLPNLREISLRSDVLGVDINLKLCASTIRTVNKYGNIDSFLINYSFNKLSDIGKKLRLKIKKKLILQNKLSEVKVIKNKKILKRLSQ